MSDAPEMRGQEMTHAVEPGFALSGAFRNAMTFGESTLPTLKLPYLPHGEILRELAERNSMKGSFCDTAATKTSRSSWLQPLYL